MSGGLQDEQARLAIAHPRIPFQRDSSVVRKKVHPIDKALDHFDDFYKQVFKKQWPSIREGLLAKPKYVAVINNFGDCEETMSKLELSGALNMRTLFNLEKDYMKEELRENSNKQLLKQIMNLDKQLEKQARQSKKTEEKPSEKIENTKNYSLEASLEHAELDHLRIVDSKNALSTEILNEFVPATKIKGKEDFIPESTYYQMFDSTASSQVKIEKDYNLNFPDNLNVYCYEMDNYNDFEPVKKSSTGVSNYYLMDGGSILPVLALDLKPGSKVLDMCAAPGGKSLLAIQTLYPELVVSNDLSNSRVNRIQSVFNQFLYDFNEKWLDTEKIRLQNSDARFIEDLYYDRILVDVPCTTDRHSLKENDNNIFKPSRIKERLKLPELQAELLFNALRIVKPGGVVVYSTCSLSPIQNDGVVSMALRRIWEETKFNIVVKDLSIALLQGRNVYNIAKRDTVKLGHLVLPSMKQNYGPTYFCKLKKIE
ncbi:5-methylcytosine rRNA methyltransferase NSUN4-like [Sitophilus oryzae]|uniref:NOL1/NOP2/Sun domain family member 4 n=1 Tax=Sitophilus oryzae TaxID=7048 RepID=A0A6J2Y052_SITOR|nr:5-methylcytosine rRNA methyltransferase NSUN4-like [Sitophilus oryzae]